MPDLPITVPAFARVHDYAGAWMVDERYARSMLSAAARTDWRAHVAGAERPRMAAAKPETLAVGGGPAPKQVGVVRLCGLLMKQTTSADDGTSTVQARREVRALAADPAVSGILLLIDSPGGTAAGTDDLAREVAQANRKKPVWAFVEDLCASAAYYVASQCERVYANSRSAWVGSVGTVLALYDVSRLAADAGVEAVVFRTGPHKGAGVEGDPITADQRAAFQKLVEDTQRDFDQAVKKGRRLTDRQLAAVRTGQVWPADQAEGLGLIDGLRTFDKAAAELAAHTRESGRPAANATGGPTVDETVTAPPTQAATPAGAVTFAAVPGAAAAAAHLAEMREQTAAEFGRQQAITAAAAKYRVPAARTEAALRAGTPANEFELEALRASYAGNGVAAAVPGRGAAGPALDARVVESALLLTAGVREQRVAAWLPAADRESVMNQAQEGRFRSFSLHALMDAAVMAAGGPTYVGNRRSDDFIRHAREHARGQPAQSGTGSATVSLPGLLSNVGTKALVDMYDAQEVTWNRICGVRSHGDFKTYTRYRLDLAGAFRRVGPDGELKSVGVTETAFTNKVDSYGAILQLTRQMIINDDLGAFLELPRAIGRMSAVRLEEAVYATLLANPNSFFATGNRNLQTGAGSALSIAALDAAEAAFRNQVDPNGKPVLLAPRVLLVPPGLYTTARNLFMWQLVNESTVTTAGRSNAQPNGNPHAGKYDPVTSPYLSNTALRDQDGVALTGQSLTRWFLFADPAVRAALAVAFLNGQQTPTVESEDAPFEVLGVRWRAYHDFGVGLEDPSAAQRNDGA